MSKLCHDALSSCAAAALVLQGNYFVHKQFYFYVFHRYIQLAIATHIVK